MVDNRQHLQPNRPGREYHKPDKEKSTEKIDGAVVVDYGTGSGDTVRE